MRNEQVVYVDLSNYFQYVSEASVTLEPGLTAVSLFAGVGGFDLAMERNGIDVVATVEIDKAARSVLKKHWPNVAHFNDIKEVTSEQLLNAGFVPDRGIITGGFPCQDLSVAGKRAGLGGARSGLYWEIIRLASELRPRYLVLENVPGLLSSVCPCIGNGECVDNGRARECEGKPHDLRGGACPSGCFNVHGGAMGVVLGALVQLGYGVGYRILDAQYFGVPQRRRRVFIVGCLGDDGSTPGEILALAEGVCGDFDEGDATGGEVADDLGRGTEAHIATHSVVGSLMSREYKGASSENARDGHLIVFDQAHRGDGVRFQGDTMKTLDARMGTGGNNVPVVMQPFVKVVRSGARDEDGNLPAEQWAEQWAEQDVAPTLNVMDNTGESRATVLAFHHKQDPISDSVSPALGALGMGVMDSYAVRRLTPVECERLQGFPDDWTAGQADSARYKQMGNAVAVPVVEWIMKRLVSA